jgi:flagellar FliL protein
MAKKKEDTAMEETEAKRSETEGEEGAEGEPKTGKKKLLIIVGGVVAVLVIGLGLMFSGVLGGGKEGEHKASPEETAAKAAADAEALKPVYYELPEFLVNLNSTVTRVSFLKMSVTLELRDVATVAIMDANKPRIQDTFNTYLRELRPSDIQGSAGLYRLRTELIARLNATLGEGTVKDILFGEIIVQ